MSTVRAQIKEEGKPEYEAEVELHLEKLQGAFEASQFNDKEKHLSVPQGSFELVAPSGKTYLCNSLIATHFALIEKLPALGST